MFTKIKKPSVAGFFYPQQQSELQEMVSGYLGSSKQQPDSSRKVSGLIAPHAGYVYSGQCAADAYRWVQGKTYARVVVMAPCHRQYYPGVAVYSQGVFETPLGEIPVDETFTQDLLERSRRINSATEPYAQEHSLEVHLPFLQVALKEPFQLVPLLLGDLGVDDLQYLASRLRSLASESEGDTLFVASTDFSHFLTEGKARDLDFHGKDLILKRKPEELLAAERGGKTSLCGILPVYTLMHILQNEDIHFVSYAHSGEVTQDSSSVVGYMSFVFVQS